MDATGETPLLYGRSKNHLITPVDTLVFINRLLQPFMLSKGLNKQMTYYCDIERVLASEYTPPRMMILCQLDWLVGAYDISRVWPAKHSIS